MSCSRLLRSPFPGEQWAPQRLQSYKSLPFRSGILCLSKAVLISSSRGPWVAIKERHSSLGAHRATIGRRILTCKAISLPDTVDATIRNVISISAVVGISYAVLLAVVSEPPPPLTPASRSLPPGPAQGANVSRNSVSSSSTGRSTDDNFVWGLMGFISFLPLFDWLAWVLAAISDEDRAALYGIYAALYGSPLLLRGLNWQDPWVLFMLALCVIHVQVERIAQTEPEALRSIRPVGAVGAALRGLVGGTGSLLAGLGGVLAEDSRRAVRRPGGSAGSSSSGGSSGPAQLGPGDDRLQLGQDADLVKRGPAGSPDLEDPRRELSRDPDFEDFAVRELRQFDEQLSERAEQRRRRRGGSRGGGGPPGGGAGGGSRGR